MSALPESDYSVLSDLMSAMRRKADIGLTGLNVRFTPKADIRGGEGEAGPIGLFALAEPSSAWDRPICSAVAFPSSASMLASVARKSANYPKLGRVQLLLH